jgi:hypothetical protein
MKTFLTKEKKPIIKFTRLPDNTFYEGKVPTGYTLGVCPGIGYFVIDVDRHDEKCGFNHIPESIFIELEKTFHYPTKNNGMHYWFKYTGNKVLLNKASGIGIDLRCDNKGYVCFYKGGDPRDCLHLIKESSEDINKWVESYFS